MQRLLLALSTLTMLAALVSGVAGSVSSEPGHAPPLAAGPPSIEITVGASPARQILLDETIAAYRSSGLELPSLEVRFFDDAADCKGHHGLFIERTDPKQVLVCSELAFVLPHEFAHAWVSVNLNDDERGRYVRFRGLLTWDDPSADWDDRGTEDAAFIIQQNLMATNPSLASTTWTERIAAYEFLTGRVSPLISDPSVSAP